MEQQAGESKPHRPPMPKVFNRRVGWAAFFATTALSSLLLGLAIAFDILEPPSSQPERAACDIMHNSFFWQGASQVLPRIVVILSLLFILVREGGKRQKIGASRLLFYLAAGISIFSEVTGLVLSGIICGSNVRIVSLVLGWTASVAAATAAALLVGSLSRESPAGGNLYLQ